MVHHHTFLFTVSSRTVIDAAVGGNDTRFINHSCAPNCEAVIEDRRVFIDALRAIPVGSELFYDYAYERATDAGPEDEARYPCIGAAPELSGQYPRATAAQAPSASRRAAGPAGGSRRRSRR